MNAQYSTVLFRGEPLKIARDPRISDYAQERIDSLDKLLADSRGWARQLDNANKYLADDLTRAEKRIAQLEAALRDQ